MESRTASTPDLLRSALAVERTLEKRGRRETTRESWTADVDASSESRGMSAAAMAEIDASSERCGQRAARRSSPGSSNSAAIPQPGGRPVSLPSSTTARTAARLPLRSFRSSTPTIRAESFDVVPPVLLVPPDVPIRGFSRGDAALVLDRELGRLAAADARCRLVRARIAERVIASRAWRALGFVRLSDFARERLGLSPRVLEDDARMVRDLAGLPHMRAALESAEISWTRARAILRAATPGNEAFLLEQSRAVPMRDLEAWVRRFATTQGDASGSSATDGPAYATTDVSVVHGGLASGTADASTAPDGPAPQGTNASASPVASAAADDPFVRWSIDLSRTGRRLWRAACEYASRSAGSALSPAQVMELVVAEAVSGRESAGVHLETQDGPATTPGRHERRLRERIRAREARGQRELLGFLAEYGAAEGFAWLDPTSRDPGPAAAVDALLDDLDHAPAFDLEQRLQQLRILTQRMEGQMAALLRTGVDRRLFRELGFASVKLYAEARLGLCARRVWSLVAIERESWRKSRLLHEAWKDGRLTSLQATALLPVLSERHAGAWIERAGQVTLRRLHDEVAWALDHGQGPPFHAENAAPPPLDADLRADGLADVTDDEVQKRAHEAPPHGAYGTPGAVRMDFVLPLSVAVLVEKALDLFRQPQEGRWHAFERMVALALLEWRSTPRHPDPVFERDGWRCAVPGCSSRRNLQDHHIVFRSKGGGNGRGNRITVCASHHLFGIHAGIVRVEGVAPHGLRWELGCGAGRPPLMRLFGDRLDLDPPSPAVILAR